MKVGLITEGAIDQALLPPLIAAMAHREGVTWPINFEDDLHVIRIRKSGHGGVLEKVRAVCAAVRDGLYTRPDILVIVLDKKKTESCQDEVKELIRGLDWVVFGIAVEEIEAWWLADQEQVLGWLQLSRDRASRLGYDFEYSPEYDENPKLMLDKLTAESDAVNYRYHGGNLSLAKEFCDVAWSNGVDLERIRGRCAMGFAPFMRKFSERCGRGLRG